MSPLGAPGERQEGRRGPRSSALLGVPELHGGDNAAEALHVPVVEERGPDGVLHAGLFLCEELQRRQRPWLVVPQGDLVGV